MEFEIKYLTEDIKLSEFKGKLFKTEVVFDHHMLVWFLSGEAKIILPDSSYTFGSGEIFLISRNQLATIINYATDGLGYKAVVMYLTQERLKNFYAKHRPANRFGPVEKIYSFTTHPLLKSCIASLVPYFDLTDSLPQDIADIKIEEAITILRSIDKNVDSLLTDFNEPGKINLADFMERHYMFNMTIDKFSYLTGRSLATFRRDFKKVFKTTPQKWLTDKRLQLAHYQIAEKQRRPVDVYMETGFENLSHFSYAFKAHFGYAPHTLMAKTLSANGLDRFSA